MLETLTGIGVDTVEIERIKNAVERRGTRFLNRIFTAAEQSYCESKRERYACYAVRFAAKEAVLKALGTGIADAKWSDVEVCKKVSGAPVIQLHGATAARARTRGVGKVLISLTHDRSKATAFAVIIEKEGVENASCHGRGNEEAGPNSY